MLKYIAIKLLKISYLKSKNFTKPVYYSNSYFNGRENKIKYEFTWMYNANEMICENGFANSETFLWLPLNI